MPKSFPGLVVEPAMGPVCPKSAQAPLVAPYVSNEVNGLALSRLPVSGPQALTPAWIGNCRLVRKRTKRTPQRVRAELKELLKRDKCLKHYGNICAAALSTSCSIVKKKGLGGSNSCQ